jgi:cytochrome c oxidase cbb3-type subunit 3
MTTSWSAYIIVLTGICLALVIWVLFGNRTRPGDQGAGHTTGHSYDGIEEFDNPLPAWWFYMFVITLVFSAGYLIAYPGLGSFKGVLGWTELQQWEHEVEQAEAKYGPVFAQYRDMSLEEIAGDTKAMKMGQRIYANNCSQCHGSDARGNRGFPNLTDDDWIWGGTPDAIHATIIKGRQAAMPPWVAVLGEDGVHNTALYALTLSGAVEASEQSAAGETHFKTICAGCHGAEGKGNPMLGAPNLTDDIWLYGSELETVKHGLRFGRNGKMPAFEGVLSDDKIHLVAGYVYSLSNK